MLLYYTLQVVASRYFVYYNIIEVIILDKYGLKNRIRISNAIDKELWEQLKSYSKETGIPISKLLDKSISLFLESTKK